MADINSSLPIRTRAAGDIAAKIVDSAGSNLLAIDASGRLTSLLHDGTNALTFAVVNSAFGATPAALRIVGKYEVTPTTYADGDAVPLLVDANGRLQVDIVSGAGGTTDTDDDIIAAGQTLNTNIGLMYGFDGVQWERIATDGSGSMDVNVSLALPAGTNKLGSIDLNDGAGTALTSTLVGADQSLDVNVTQIVGVTEANSGSMLTSLQTIDNIVLLEDAAHTSGDSGIMSLAVRNDIAGSLVSADGDYSPLQVDASGSLRVSIENSEANSIPVYITSGLSGTEIHNYNTATVTASGTNNHDVTVTATKTFMLKQIIIAASGEAKWELQVGPVLSLATKMVFFTSSDSSSKSIIFDKPIEVPDTSTGTVRLIRTNRESSSMDVYSTIIGDEI